MQAGTFKKLKNMLLLIIRGGIDGI